MVRNVARERKQARWRSACITNALVLLMVLGLARPGSAARLPAPQPAQGTIQLRVLTPAYRWQDGSIVVDGYGQVDTPGAPLLPMWSTLVPLPPDGDWSLEVQSVGTQQLPTLGTLPAVPVPQPDLQGPQGPLQNPDLTWAGHLVDQPDPAIYQHDGLFPATTVQAGPELWRRGQHLLPVHVFPFQYNPPRGVLTYHPELQIQITVVPSAESQGSDHQDPLLQSSAQIAGDEEGALRVYTKQRGLYRLTQASLAQAGVPVETIAPATFTMTYLGQPVSILVTGSEDGRFDPGDTVIFYAEPYDGRYMTYNVYRLSYGGSQLGDRMGTRSLKPSGDEPLVTTITRTLHVEFDEDYRSAYERPKEADHWFDMPLYVSDLSADTATSSVAYALGLQEPVNTRDLELRVLIHGGVNQAANPDQSIAVRFNSHQVGVFQWEGSTDLSQTRYFPIAMVD